MKININCSDNQHKNAIKTLEAFFKASKEDSLCSIICAYGYEAGDWMAWSVEAEDGELYINIEFRAFGWDNEGEDV